MKDKIMSKVVGVLSLFSEIEIDEDVETKQTGSKEAAPKESGKTLAANQPVIGGSPGQPVFDPAIALTIEKTIREETKEFGYINLKDAIVQMKESMPSSDEASRYKTAFIFAKTTFSITRQKLLNSAKRSIDIALKERDVFFGDVRTDQEEKIGGKQTELKAIEDQIVSNNSTMEKLRQENERLLTKQSILKEEVENYEKGVAGKINAFEHTLKTVVSNIEADIGKFEKYIDQGE